MKLATRFRLGNVVATRGAIQYVDQGVSGAKDKRPALDQLVADAKRRRFDVVLAWRLDRVGQLAAPGFASGGSASRWRHLRIVE
jgi:DNA invertase Pin-like site-specific DNA recombinase